MKDTSLCNTVGLCTFMTVQEYTYGTLCVHIRKTISQLVHICDFANIQIHVTSSTMIVNLSRSTCVWSSSGCLPAKCKYHIKHTCNCVLIYLIRHERRTQCIYGKGVSTFIRNVSAEIWIGVPGECVFMCIAPCTCTYVILKCTVVCQYFEPDIW